MRLTEFINKYNLEVRCFNSKGQGRVVVSIHGLYYNGHYKNRGLTDSIGLCEIHADNLYHCLDEIIDIIKYADKLYMIPESKIGSCGYSMRKLEEMSISNRKDIYYDNHDLFKLIIKLI